MIIRRFEKCDAQTVSKLVVKTLRVSNLKDYSAEEIERLCALHTPAYIIERSGWTHFYVAADGEKIIGCGAIGPYWDKTDESCLFTIFVLPEYQGRGVGRAIVETLERDGFALRAKRIEVHASVTGVPFYLKLGYRHKNGEEILTGDGLYNLEKFR
ncbi:MAG: GNAT family N-acetyltransferase [Clostridia bacterium]|nr:GNAT family N-acetyltransferase [Clostridia bacterium]